MDSWSAVGALARLARRAEPTEPGERTGGRWGCRGRCVLWKWLRDVVGQHVRFGAGNHGRVQVAPLAAGLRGHGHQHVGGLFLLGKSTFEIHERLEGDTHQKGKAAASFTSVITQVMLLDIVFSLDSVITAIGMADDLRVMVTAVVLAVMVMMLAAEPISAFVDKHPTIKVLALSFLLLIGVSLIADGLDQHIPKGYIYFAMAFSVFVEMINIRVRGKSDPVKLHQPYVD